jgi:hypothetical protein
LGDAAAGRGHGDLRLVRSRVVGRGGPPCFGGLTRPLPCAAPAAHGFEPGRPGLDAAGAARGLRVIRAVSGAFSLPAGVDRAATAARQEPLAPSRTKADRTAPGTPSHRAITPCSTTPANCGGTTAHRSTTPATCRGATAHRSTAPANCGGTPAHRSTTPATCRGATAHRSTAPATCRGQTAHRSTTPATVGGAPATGGGTEGVAPGEPVWLSPHACSPTGSLPGLVASASTTT